MHYDQDGQPKHTRIHVLEQELAGLAERITHATEDELPMLLDACASKLQALTREPAENAADVAALLRVFLREISGHEYHASPEFSALIQNALGAAERLERQRLLRIESFEAGLVAFEGMAANVRCAMLPIEATAVMAAIGAQVTGVSADLVSEAYSRMTAAFRSSKRA